MIRGGSHSDIDCYPRGGQPAGLCGDSLLNDLECGQGSPELLPLGCVIDRQFDGPFGGSDALGRSRECTTQPQLLTDAPERGSQAFLRKANVESYRVTSLAGEIPTRFRDVVGTRHVTHQIALG